MVYEALLELKKQGLSMLLIEQNAAMALVVCDYIYLLNRGEVAMEGKGSDLRASEELIDAYMG
jgi:branched-chain amino acid transport system ATP-binding protein